MSMIWYLLIAAPISGTLGRMGGAHGYNTKWRDWGCALLITLGVAFWQGFSLSLWWLYLAVFFLHWGALSTYWDWLFKGVDNLWFAGIMVGLALAPVAFINSTFLIFVLLRAVLLCAVWGCLNKHLPQRVLVWRRDVAEEFLRYAVLI